MTDHLPAAIERKRDLALCLALVLCTFAVYAQLIGCDFVNADDGLYVLYNPHVRDGLTADNIRWALTAVVASNWTPVTLLSHMLDVELFDLNSGMHHLVNVALHAIASVLLFLSLKRATKAPWPSAFVAFVFALHPLHVESVAWISERKDVLCALFWFLTLYCYIWYTERPTASRYLLVLAAFCLGLMSKPMIVTLPFALLLFDFWPLHRIQSPKVVWEKVPMFALSAFDSVVTWFFQKYSSGAFELHVSLPIRIQTALVSYATYLWQTIWPVRLAVYYPYRTQGPDVSRVIASVFVLLVVSLLAVLLRRKYPYFLTGWFWFLGTLVPVIGLVQVGGQAHADRYAYIPMVGLGLVIAWGAADFIAARPRIQPLVAVAAGAVCVILGAVAWRQVGYWRNDETLNQHAIDVVPDNDFAHNNLAVYLYGKHRTGEAFVHEEEAVRIRPGNWAAQQNLGLHYAWAGLYGNAMPHLESALRANPKLFESSTGIGLCLMMTQRYQESLPYLEDAIRIQPKYYEAHLTLAQSLQWIPGREPDAIHEFETALKLRPDSVNAHHDLGMLLAVLGRREEAVEQLQTAFQISHSDETKAVIDRLRQGSK